MMGEAENILIYRLGSLGDTIMALPAFHVIREAYPKSRITLLTNLPVAGKAAPAAVVLGEHYFFDEVMDYPVGLRNPRQIGSLIRRIRDHRISTVVNLTAFRSVFATRRDQLFFRCGGARRLIGFSTKLEDQKPVMDRQNGMVEWEGRRLARRVASLREIDLDDNHWWDLKLTAAETAKADALVRPTLGGRPCLAISLGTKLQSNDWGLANWQELVKRLSSRLAGWGLIFIGASEEKAGCEACLRQWSGPSINLSGLCPPRISAAVLQSCRAFAGHDSGPLHLAACVGIPCVGVFSARNLPGRWFPRGRHNEIIYHRTPCAGCELGVCIAEKKKCITSVTVQEVEQAVLKTLDLPVIGGAGTN